MDFMDGRMEVRIEKIEGGKEEEEEEEEDGRE